MNDNTVTTDMSEFGYRELAMTRDLLAAYIDQNNTKFLGAAKAGDGVQIWFNKNSGNVFLCDEDYNTAMESDGELCDWFVTPYNGCEGFLEDLLDEYSDMHPEDQEYIDQIKVAY